MLIDDKVILFNLLEQKKDFSYYTFENMDLSKIKLNDYDFSHATFNNIDFSAADLSNNNFFHCRFKNVSLKRANLSQCNLQECDFIGNDLSNCNISGSNLYFSILEQANLEGVIYDEKTEFFKLRCPEKKAFIGYKKCVDYRIVKLLIPSEAKRTSATNEACRCSKAKVLSITNIADTKTYKEAQALADGNFIYRVGEWVSVDDFDEYRWHDGSRGIHVYLNRDEAINY